MIKKILCGFLVLFSVIFLSISTSAETIASGDCGENLTWSLDDVGNLTICGTGDMTNWSSLSEVPWSSYQASVKNCTIEDGVTSIGNYAFGKCDQLMSICISKDVLVIGDYAFRDCTSLTDVVIPDYVTDIGLYAFAICDNLKNIIIPDSVVNMEDSAFYNCKSLESVVLSHGITSIGHSMFYNCKSLTSIEIPDRVLTLNNFAFAHCTSLESVTLPVNLETIGVQVFNGCSSLTEIEIPNTVTNVGNSAFTGCVNLSGVYIDSIESWCKIDFGNMESNPVYYAKELYLNDNPITYINIPHSITKISKYAFINNSLLTSINLPPKLSIIGEDAFNNCTGLNSINISDMESWCKVIFENEAANPLYYAKNLYLNNIPVTHIIIPESITKINEYAFINCTSAKYLLLHNKIETTGVSAFSGCSLTDVYFDGSFDNYKQKGLEFYDQSLHCLDTTESVNVWKEKETSMFSAGSGTESDPYIITTASELAYLAKFVNSGQAAVGLYYELGNNINLGGNEWTPIGNANFPFRGHFNGNGYQITNLCINNKLDNQGLFGVTGNCGSFSSFSTIKNLSVIDCSVSGNNYVGGIVGKASTCMITDCVCSGKVKGNNNVGGIAGFVSHGNFGYEQADSCVNLASVSGNESVGGIAGFGYASIVNCANYGDVTGITCVGGIRGKNSQTSIKRCFNKGTISGNSYIGGITGSTTLSAVIENCYNKGDVIGDGAGITRDVYQNSAYVNRCYSTGLVLQGYPALPNALSMLGGSYDYVYYVKEETGDRYKHTNGKGTGLSETDITNKLKFNGFDFTNIWIMGPTGPELRDNREEDIRKYQQVFTDKQQYIYDHIKFVNSGDFEHMCNEFGFHDAIWEHQKLKGLKVALSYLWGVTGNIGELMSFDFGDLKITADIYDMYVTDMVVDLTNDELAKKWDAKIFSIYSKFYTKIDELLGREPEWLSAMDNNANLRIETKCFLNDPNYELSPVIESKLSDLFDEVFYDNYDLFEGIFDGFDKASKLCDIVKGSNDSLNAFRDAQKAYTVVMCYKELDKFITDSLYAAADEMEKIDAKKAEKYRKSIDKYEKSAKDDDALLDAALEIIHSTAVFYGEKVLEKTIMPMFYSKAASFLGLSITDFNKAVAAYLITYDVMDLLTNNSEKTDAYLNIAYLAPLEKAFSSIAKEKATMLMSKQDLNSAMDFDSAYLLLKKTNEKLYDQSYKFAASKKQESEMYYSLLYKNKWINTNCHAGIYVFSANDSGSQNSEASLISATDYRYVEVHCPVDVYLYEDDHLIASVIDEQISSADSDIRVINGSGKKAFIIPADKYVDIEIIPREDGFMKYSVKEFSENSNKVRSVEFYDLQLTEGSKYTGDIPSGLDYSNTVYNLKSEGKGYTCDYDSSLASECDENGHTWNEMYISTAEENIQSRDCQSCGKKESYAIEPEIEAGFYTDSDSDLINMIVSVPGSVETNVIVVAQFQGERLVKCDTVLVADNKPFEVSPQADMIKTMLLDSLQRIKPASEKINTVLTEVEEESLPTKQTSVN